MRLFPVLMAFSLQACFIRSVTVEADELTFDDDIAFVDATVGAGDIVVLLDGGDQTVVERTVRYAGKHPDLRAEVMGGVLHLEVDCPPLSRQCGGDLVVHLRASADTSLHTGSGNIDVEGMTASVDATTGSGDIELIDITGDVALETGSGNITANGLVSTTIDADTGSGDVDLVLDEPASAVWIDTGSGQVVVETPKGSYQIDTQTGSGDVELRGVTRSAGSPHRIDVGTGSGDIDIIGR